LSIPEGLKITGAIGDFVVGHVDDCLPRYTLVYVPGSGVIDGEIVETLWAVLNKTSRSAKGVTMAHRNEILDDHMNHLNWKKPIGMKLSLVQKMKWAINLLKGPEESYKKLTESVVPADLEAWQEGEMTAQQNWDKNVKSMDYYALKCKRGTVLFISHFQSPDLKHYLDQPQVN
ncbi:hypothetical protein L208DRAFT_1514834, partial [Tricholoma matsutake]